MQGVTGTDAGGEADAAAPPSDAMPSGDAPPDAAALAACDAACSTLIGCGATYDKSTCADACARNRAEVACIQGSANDCNSLAPCAFQQICAACSGNPCLPAGADACTSTSDCVGRCQGDPTCICGCTATLAPAKELTFLVEQTCAAACAYGVSCEVTECATQFTQCMAN